jgi:transcription antitermination factor NusG
VLKTPGVVNFLSVSQNEPTPVPEDQINTLKILLDNKKKIDPYPYLKEGQKITIKKGPLAGVNGILIKKENQHLLVIAVDILRKGLYIKIDASDVDA